MDTHVSALGVDGTRSSRTARRFLLTAFAAMIAAVTCYKIAPLEQRGLIFSNVYFESFLRSPWGFRGFWVFESIYAVSMIGVILAFLRTRPRTVTAQWLAAIGVIGYALMCLTYVSRTYFITRMAHAFVTGSPELRNVIVAYGIKEFDYFNMAYGFPAIWFAGLGVSVFRQHRTMGVVSILIAVGYVVTVYGYLAFIPAVLAGASTSAFLLFAIWAVLAYRYFALSPALADVDENAQRRAAA
jgi:hypothetical protein